MINTSISGVNTSNFQRMMIPNVKVGESNYISNNNIVINNI